MFQGQAGSVIGVRREVCMGLMGPDRGAPGRLVGAPPGHRPAERCLLLSQQPGTVVPAPPPPATPSRRISASESSVHSLSRV